MSDAPSILTEQLKQQRQNFVASALKAESEVAQNHLVYDADDVFRYIQAKVEGRSVKRPQAATLK